MSHPSGYEVDFLAVSPDGSTELIQVCADLGDDSVRQRERMSLARSGSGVSARPQASHHARAPQNLWRASSGHSPASGSSLLHLRA